MTDKWLEQPRELILSEVSRYDVKSKLHHIQIQKEPDYSLREWRKK